MDGSADFKSNVEFEIGFGFSPLGDIVPEAQRSGRRERGFPVLHYNPSMPIKNIVTEQRITKEKLQRACELRRDMTAAEKLLWNELRANKLGFHFRRQQIIAGFIVDFYCHKAALVVEVDGDIHDLQQEEDTRREKVLTDLGLRIVRLRNEEILKELSMVLESIKEKLCG